MSLQITTPPTVEPVTLDEVKKRLRLTTTADDADITGHITTAREYAESVTSWSLAAKSYRDTRDRFPHPYEPIKLLRPPLVSVESVQYLDDSYAWATWDPTEYWVALDNVPALIVPKRGLIYPHPAEVPGCVRINFTVGASTYTPHLEGIRQLAVHIYEHPEAVTSEGLKEIPLAISSFFNVKKVHYF
jgi:uncharacterized phiE125 gp8 family phage protein